MTGGPAAPALRSMTGFASAEGAHGALRWTWILRSVNGKGLDLKLRLPPGFEAAEAAIRKSPHGLRRGTVSATCKLDRAPAETALRVDEDALAAVLTAIEAVRARIDCAPPRPEAVLQVGGVLKAGPDGDGPSEADIAAVTDSFAEAAAALRAERRREGAALAEVLSAQLDEIERLTAEAAREAEAAVPDLRDRLAAQIGRLTDEGMEPERLAQEAAFLAVKADTAEEIDRLQAHVAAARDHLIAGEPVGRKLEFLAQEFARESTTLTTKAPNMAMKRTGLALRHVVDQLREQVLNVE